MNNPYRTLPPLPLLVGFEAAARLAYRTFEALGVCRPRAFPLHLEERLQEILERDGLNTIDLINGDEEAYFHYFVPLKQPGWENE